MNKKILLGKKEISLEKKPYIIAEISANHNQNFKNAIKLIKFAKISGADAIKLQTFKPEKITLNSDNKDFIISDKKSPWYKKKLYNLFEEAYTPWSWHEKLFKYAKSIGLDYFSTPFHEDAVDFLESLKVPYYKISSFENNHLPLIDKVSKLKKPVLVSTGMASKKDLLEIIKIFKKNNNKKLILLKCVSCYPAKSEDFNLNILKKYQEEFNCLTGLSDHSLDSTAANVSVSLGARVFEKHISLKNVQSLDSSFSTDENNFNIYVKSIQDAYKSMGKTIYGAVNSEKASLQERRSIYIVKNVKKNELITNENISVIRPSYGLSPKMKNKVLNKKFKKDLKIGQRLKIDYIKN
tara:strand:+ start:1427 stop:2482 length:1056 start_codon:yes stop_codon:yes gene_type:complete